MEKKTAVVMERSETHVAKCGRCEQFRWFRRVFHVGDGNHCIEDAKVDDSIHSDSDAVFREDFLRGNIERHCSKVDFAVRIDAR